MAFNFRENVAALLILRCRGFVSRMRRAEKFLVVCRWNLCNRRKQAGKAKARIFRSALSCVIAAVSGGRALSDDLRRLQQHRCSNGGEENQSGGERENLVHCGVLQTGCALKCALACEMPRPALLDARAQTNRAWSACVFAERAQTKRRRPGGVRAFLIWPPRAGKGGSSGGQSFLLKLNLSASRCLHRDRGHDIALGKPRGY
jgi:hypothetical protein